MNNSNWKKLGTYSVGTSDGGRENYTLSENEATGDFRISNDFGNVTIDMERMSAYEFLKRVVRDMEDTMMPSGSVSDDVWLDDLLNGDCDYDDLNCDHTD